MTFLLKQMWRVKEKSSQEAGFFDLSNSTARGIVKSFCSRTENIGYRVFVGRYNLYYIQFRIGGPETPGSMNKWKLSSIKHAERSQFKT